MIAIDDASIANIGRWPWPRDVHAKMVDLLAAAKAKVIGYTVFFSEPQIDPGYRYITQLLDMARKAPPGTPEGEAMAPFVTLLTQAEDSLNPDRKLADSYARAGNVLLPMLFTLGQPRGRPDQPLPEFVQKNVCPRVSGDEGFALPTESVQIPVQSIGRAGRRPGPPERLPGRRRRDPHRAAGGALLRPVLPVAVDADRRQEPEPRAGRHLGAPGRGRVARQPEDRHRPGDADAHLLLQGPRRQARVPGRLVLRRAERQDPGQPSTPARSCSSALPPPASAPPR